jgi:hypothetical protein
MDDLFTKTAIIVAALLATLSSFPLIAQRQPEPARQQQTIPAMHSPNHPNRKLNFKSAMTTEHGLTATTKENTETARIEIPKDGCG